MKNVASTGSETDSQVRTREFRALGEQWGGQYWQRPLGRALMLAGLTQAATPDSAAMVVRRWANGERPPPDDVVDWLRGQIAKGGPRWVIGRADNGDEMIVHLRQPWFSAPIIDGRVAEPVIWATGNPPAKIMGPVLVAAQEHLEGPSRRADRLAHDIRRPRRG